MKCYTKLSVNPKKIKAQWPGKQMINNTKLLVLQPPPPQHLWCRQACEDLWPGSFCIHQSWAWIVFDRFSIRSNCILKSSCSATKNSAMQKMLKRKTNSTRLYYVYTHRRKALTADNRWQHKLPFQLTDGWLCAVNNWVTLAYHSRLGRDCMKLRWRNSMANMGK